MIWVKPRQIKLCKKCGEMLNPTFDKGDYCFAHSSLEHNENSRESLRNNKDKKSDNRHQLVGQVKRDIWDNKAEDLIRELNKKGYTTESYFNVEFEREELTDTSKAYLILIAAARAYKTSIESMLSRNRCHVTIKARTLAVKCIRDFGYLSFTAIASLFDGRAHTSIIRDYYRAENKFLDDKFFRKAYENIKLMINAKDAER